MGITTISTPLLGSDMGYVLLFTLPCLDTYYELLRKAVSSIRTLRKSPLVCLIQPMNAYFGM
jgi:hypothetical protein